MQTASTTSDVDPGATANDAAKQLGSTAVNGDNDLGGDDDVWIDEPGESTEDVSACAEHWRAAGPDSRKRMFALFDACGIFAAVCWHGHVLTICDMVRTGEQ